MGGIFGVASKKSCVSDLFFGTDYHSHLGTRRGGMAVYDKTHGFDRAIHNIQNSPFRTKFERDVDELEGTLGIGCISDSDPQPLMVQSHLGSFAITTVGRINNMDQLVKHSFANGCTHFLEMSGGNINATEMVASLINQKPTLVEGIRYAQEMIASRFAFRKFLIFYYYLCCINFLSVSVRVASCLNTTTYHDLQSLTEILFSKLGCSSKRYATDEISTRFSISLKSSVYSQSVSCNCQ